MARTKAQQAIDNIDSILLQATEAMEKSKEAFFDLDYAGYVLEEHIDKLKGFYASAKTLDKLARIRVSLAVSINGADDAGNDQAIQVLNASGEMLAEINSRKALRLRLASDR